MPLLGAPKPLRFSGFLSALVVPDRRAVAMLRSADPNAEKRTERFARDAMVAVNEDHWPASITFTSASLSARERPALENFGL